MIDFHALTTEASFKELKSSVLGLDQKEAIKRSEKYGLNKLPEGEKASWLQILWTQFKSPLIIVLIIAGLISYFVKEKLDAQVIFAAVLINAIIGFIQENKANNSLEQLKKIIENRSLVLRDGEEKEIKSEELVPGDIIILSSGSRIAADARVIESIDLEINEAPLTGESVSVFKELKPLSKGTVLAERSNMVYSGCLVVGGTGKALVVATGQDTEIGRISQLVKSTKEGKTPLQTRLLELSKIFGLAAFILAIVIMLVGVWQERSFFEIFLTAIAVGVAAIPEGLVVAVTVILVLGMKQILKQKALTRKLVAAETLGSTTVICTDKTGTLTEGKMRVNNLFFGSDFVSGQDMSNKMIKKEEGLFLLLKIGLMCNDAFIEKGDDLEAEKIVGLPLEKALISFGLELGLDKMELQKLEPRVSELPFSSERKFMITINQAEKGYRLYEKGALERILPQVEYFLEGAGKKKADANYKRNLLAQYESLTSKGLRVIALAYKDLKSLPFKEGEKKDWDSLNKGLILAGLIAFKDPLRPEAKQTIKICKRAGIRPIIITGDHQLTAQAIAQEVGLDGENAVITGEQLEAIDDTELRELVKKHSVYARVSPHHKLRIVEALKRNGEVVAMTGDGLNDSPALKASDIGICLGSGTEIAKETSDIVLLDDNFSVIVSAIREGRVIFQNIRKSITYLISDCFSEIVLILGSLFFNMPLAILPTQILWINIINDGFPNFSMAFEKSDRDVLADKPISRKEPLLNKEMKIIIVGVGLVRDILIFALFFYIYHNLDFFGFDLKYLRTLMFALLAFKSVTSIFSLRSFHLSFFRIKQFRNWYLLLAVGISITLLMLAIYLPAAQQFMNTSALDMRAWALIFSLSFINILMIETVKYFFIPKAHDQR